MVLCGETSLAKKILDDFSLNSSFSIYPNPVNTFLNINLTDNDILTKVIIIDITGKIVLEQTDNLATVNVENLANGLYIIELLSAEKSYQGKFIKN